MTEVIRLLLIAYEHSGHLFSCFFAVFQEKFSAVWGEKNANFSPKDKQYL